MKLKLNSRTLWRANFSMGALAIALGIGHAQTYQYTTIDASNDPSLVGTVVSSINDSGQTAGYYVNQTMFGPAYSAFTSHLDGSGFSTLMRPGAIAMGGSGVNNSGQIVGVSVDGSFTSTGFLRDPNGSYTTIDPSMHGLASGYSEAVGINNSGSIDGFFYDSPPSQANPHPAEHGFIDNNGVYTQYDAPIGHDTELYSINDAGAFTGQFIDNFGAPHGFVYDPVTGFAPTILPGFFATTTGAINDLGEYTASGIVPDNTNATGYDAYGFIFSGGTYHPFAVPGALSTEPYAINDLGDVSGFYVDQNHVIHGFTAMPVPEPLPVVSFGLMAGGFLLRRRKKLGV